MSATTSPQKEKANAAAAAAGWVKFEDTDEVQDSGGGSPSKATQDLQGPPYVFATLILNAHTQPPEDASANFIPDSNFLMSRLSNEV